MEEIVPGDSGRREFSTKRLANIIGEVDRARAVMRELGQLSRRKSYAVEPLNLKSVVERAVRFPGVEIDSDIEVAIEIRENIRIWGDDHLMRTVITNLTSDIVTALGGEGRVVYQAQPAIDGALEVTVTGTGKPSPGGDRDEMFSPASFTDKGGKRIGLRLAITCEIIKTHGGKIWAERTRGKGKTFRLRLPTPESAE
jgi:signal transduction histidine kinase